MAEAAAASILEDWPKESREAAQLVLDKYGEPDEATPSTLVWFNAGEWKRIIATKAFYEHNFPAPHFDSVESVIDYAVPVGKGSALAGFDGSVIIERTAGEVSARCHDEEANRLALNLVHDVVTGAKDVEQARAYYAQEFAGYRKKEPTPYMEKLHFTAQTGTADPDQRVLSDEELEQAADDGERKDQNQGKGEKA